MVVYCSDVARESLVNFGFNPDRTTVVPVGVDIDYFHCDKEKGSAIRQEIGITVDDCLIGTVARYGRGKDVPGFIKAAAEMTKRFKSRGDPPLFL